MVISAGKFTALCETTANLFISSKKLSIWRLPFCFGADELAGGGGASWNCTGDTLQRVRSFDLRRAQVSGGGTYSSTTSIRRRLGRNVCLLRACNRLRFVRRRFLHQRGRAW